MKTPIDTCVISDEFKLIPDDIFEQVDPSVNLDYIAQRDQTKYYECPICMAHMQPCAIGYECTCGYVNEIHESTDGAPVIVKINTSSGGRTMFGGGGNYAKTQRKQILNEMLALHDAAAKMNDASVNIPIDVIYKTVDFYNDIQKIMVDERDENGEVIGQRKSIRRGTIKDEILGTCLYYTCVAEKLFHKKKDIARFMQIDGISRGEKKVRELANMGKITLPSVVGTERDLILRYLAALDLYVRQDSSAHGTMLSQTSVPQPHPNQEKYVGFVTDILARSDKLTIKCNSVLSSKVVGAIWILITKLELPIAAADVEKKCDNIRKNTFSRFSDTIMSREVIVKFIPIFEKYGVPLGFTYKKVLKLK